MYISTSYYSLSSYLLLVLFVIVLHIILLVWFIGPGRVCVNNRLGIITSNISIDADTVMVCCYLILTICWFISSSRTYYLLEQGNVVYNPLITTGISQSPITHARSPPESLLYSSLPKSTLYSSLP